MMITKFCFFFIVFLWLPKVKRAMRVQRFVLSKCHLFLTSHLPWSLLSNCQTGISQFRIFVLTFVKEKKFTEKLLHKYRRIEFSAINFTEHKSKEDVCDCFETNFNCIAKDAMVSEKNAIRDDFDSPSIDVLGFRLPISHRKSTKCPPMMLAKRPKSKKRRLWTTKRSLLTQISVANWRINRLRRMFRCQLKKI